MAAAHPFDAFVGCRFKRIGCVRRIKVKALVVQHTSFCSLQVHEIKMTTIKKNKT